MSALLLFLAATAGAPEATASRRSEPAPEARATGSVSVRIVSGARIKMGEAQDSGVPVIQASSIRERDGSVRTARLVEFN